MAEALRTPPRGFEELVREHLWRKKWHVIDVVGGWLREGKRPCGWLGHEKGGWDEEPSKAYGRHLALFLFTFFSFF